MFSSPSSTSKRPNKTPRSTLSGKISENVIPDESFRSIDDLNELKVAELRSLLVERGLKVRSSARKQELIDVLNEDLNNKSSIQKSEDPDISADISAFSMDNPFQSNSPPPSNSKNHKAGRKSESSLKSNIKQAKKAITSSHPSLLKMQPRQIDDVEIEDDDEKEEEEIGKENNNGSSLWFLIVIVILAWWIWYDRESQKIGFCETSQVLQQSGNILKPSCKPCPQHAKCIEGSLIDCESSDYVLKVPIFSQIPLLRSALPISPSCEPDEEKLLLAADLADEIEMRLRSWKADVYCNRQRARVGPRDEPEWGEEGIYAFPISELYHDLELSAEKVLRTQTDNFFKEIWDLALSDLEGRVQQRSSRLLAMRGPIGIGISCRMKKVWQKLRFWLIGIIFIFGFLQSLRQRVRGTKKMQEQAIELVETSIELLQSAKRTQSEPFLSITQLRDNLLRGKNQKLWTKVTKMIESNTNIRTRQAKIQGEWARVWEWVGPIEITTNSKVRKDSQDQNEPPIQEQK